MNKKLWITFIVVFIVYFILDWLVNGVLLHSTYMAEDVARIMRSEAEVNSNMWMIVISDLVYTFFFTFIFSKGFENKGWMEGLRYGLYIGLMVSLPMAYITYAVQPIPYSLALQWFIYGTLQNIIIGIVAALLYKPKAATT
jgi:hypothetical protein